MTNDFAINISTRVKRRWTYWDIFAWTKINLHFAKLFSCECRDCSSSSWTMSCVLSSLSTINFHLQCSDNPLMSLILQFLRFFATFCDFCKPAIVHSGLSMLLLILLPSWISRMLGIANLIPQSAVRVLTHPRETIAIAIVQLIVMKHVRMWQRETFSAAYEERLSSQPAGTR